jgi:hypothetical protein
VSSGLFVAQVPATCHELNGSGPASQVIPSGGIAGFDIQLTSSEVQDFAERVEYVINGNHTFMFNVEANIRPIACEIRPEVLKFEFPDDSTDVELTRQVSIVNTSDAAAEYRWETDPVNGSSYVLNPSSGVIPPNGTVKCSVTFRALSKPSADAVMKLLVQGGDELAPPPSLTCSAYVEEPKLVFAGKKVRWLSADAPGCFSNVSSMCGNDGTDGLWPHLRGK